MKQIVPMIVCTMACWLLSATSLYAVGDPLEPMNRRVGTWVNKTFLKKAAWTTEESETTGEETVKWVLDNRFIQGDALNEDGAKGHWLMNYDAEYGVYRSWFFGNQDNQFPRTESVGKWDAEAERMDWKSNLGDGLRAEMVFQFRGEDKMEWSYKIFNDADELMMHTGGVQTRKEPSSQSD